MIKLFEGFGMNKDEEKETGVNETGETPKTENTEITDTEKQNSQINEVGLAKWDEFSGAVNKIMGDKAGPFVANNQSMVDHIVKTIVGLAVGAKANILEDRSILKNEF